MKEQQSVSLDAALTEEASAPASHGGNGACVLQPRQAL